MVIVPPTDRYWARTELTCCLRLANGGKSPDTAARCWFFEIPRTNDTLDCWKELVPRIVFDLNTNLRRREPSDTSWIDVESFTVHPLQPRQVLSMHESNPRTLGWVNFDRARVWESAVCYFVDNSANYDVMTAHDFSELLLYRLLGRGEITPEEFKIFLDRYYAASEPSAGARIYTHAEERLRNLTTIRANPAGPKKKPNELPYSCCPDAAAFQDNLSSLGVPNPVRIAGYSEPGGDGVKGTEGAFASVYMEAIGTSLIQVVVAIKDFTGLGLSEAKSLAESAPALVLLEAPIDEAERFKRELQRAGAKVSLR